MAVLGHEAVDLTKRPTAGASGGELAVPAFAVLRVQLAIPEDGVFQPFLLRETEQLLDLWADVEFRGTLIEWGDKSDSRDVLDQGAKLGLVALALADVTDDGGGEDRLLRRQWAKADLDRKLGAVLAPTEQISTGPHWPASRLGEVCVPLAGVLPPESLRDQDLDFPTE